ncbi:hypothetical protein C8034_v010302 [Colletotrichum sidae]|uniref:Uncharacterized protein n=1 Tax=Colletotrichum sidae TaxID=1347389 RepID=A0A4R8TLY1_9PEZI|nr:hypothetical protein C8034_v010302 [Colletotrichum sidae]
MWKALPSGYQLRVRQRVEACLKAKYRCIAPSIVISAHGGRSMEKSGPDPVVKDGEGEAPRPNALAASWHCFRKTEPGRRHGGHGGIRERPWSASWAWSLRQAHLLHQFKLMGHTAALRGQHQRAQHQPGKAWDAVRIRLLGPFSRNVGMRAYSLLVLRTPFFISSLVCRRPTVGPTLIATLLALV